MPVIQSIICFNGGSAGDILKALCVQNCLDQCSITDQGRAEIGELAYFKDAIACVASQQESVDSIDFQRVDSVEISHHYLDVFAQWAKQTYFINYPDHCNDGIVNIYIEKQHKQSCERLYRWHQNSLPSFLAQKANPKTIVDIVKVQWLKNLKHWRQTANMTAIDLTVLFDYVKLTHTVEQLTQQKITNQSKFDSIYKIWLSRNKNLQHLITKDLRCDI